MQKSRKPKKLLKIASFYHIGVDEVGYGSFVGPVVAGAVVFDLEVGETLRELGVKDSKRYSNTKKSSAKEKRATHAKVIKEEAYAWGIGIGSLPEIETLGVGKANFLAMQRAIRQIPRDHPWQVIVDGKNKIPSIEYSQQIITKGDDTYLQIAAASVIAKDYRDSLLAQYHEQYPYYNWLQNNGYGTPEHSQMLKCHGASPYHRSRFIRKLV